MLIPFRVIHIKDGGSIEYKAVLYSVIKVKTLSNCETTQYSKGWRIKVLSKEVIDLVNYVACDNSKIKKDPQPIYNHFPTLPKTDNIEWYSTQSDGIGLVTTRLYVFAKYDNPEEIDKLLAGMSFANVKNMEFGFKSSYLKEDAKWFKLPFDYQDGIEEHKKMIASAYVSGDNSVIYIEAVSD